MMSSIICSLCQKRVNKIKKLIAIRVRFCQTLNTTKNRNQNNRNQYSETVLLPKSNYPMKHSRLLELNILKVSLINTELVKNFNGFDLNDRKYHLKTYIEIKKKVIVSLYSLYTTARLMLTVRSISDTPSIKYSFISYIIQRHSILI